MKKLILMAVVALAVLTVRAEPSFRQIITSAKPLTLASNATTTVVASNLVAASMSNPQPGTIDLVPGQPLYTWVNLTGSAANGTTSNLVAAFKLTAPNFGAAQGKYSTSYVFATNFANGTSEVTASASISATALAGATKAQLVSFQNTSTANIITVSNYTFGVFK